MSRPGSPGPATKRIKLNDLTSQPVDVQAFEEPARDAETVEEMVEDTENAIEEDEDENSCSICLHSIVDRTVVPKCSHEFCFECLLVWTEQSRRCPLCSQAIGEYLIHSIRSRYDYRKHYLSPLRTSPPPSRPAQTTIMRQTARRNAARRHRDVEWGTRAPRAREHEEFDKLERSILKRRWIYEHDLYAKHVASNPFTKYRPYPTPSQFAASQELISRTTTFLRRELQVWESLDVEFLTNLIISLMKAIDIRSESAVKLIAEFLDLDEPYTAGGRHVNAEHFAHEVYCYVRSPYRDLFVYDKVVQYDLPSNIPPPPELERSRRWHPSSASPSHPIAGPSQAKNPRRLRSTSRSSERSESWSPSGRRYSSSRNRATFVERGTSRREVDGDNFDHLPNNVACQDKGRKRPADISANKILDGVGTETYDNASSKARFSDGLVKSSSLTRDDLDNHVPVEQARRDLKGKGRAHETRKTDAVDSESAGPAMEELQTTLNVPLEIVGPNDVGHSAEKTPMTNRLSVSRSLKPPRSNTLLDSVKAHLARNTDIKTNPDHMRAPGMHRHSANTKASPPTQGDSSHIQSRDQSTDAPLNPISEVPSLSLSAECQEETRFVDISRVGCQVSKKREENLRGGNPSDLPVPSTSLEQSELYATGGVTPEIDSSSQRDGTVSVNAANSMVLSNAITDAPCPPSSSDVSIIPEQNICAVQAKPSRLEGTRSRTALELSSNESSLGTDSFSTCDVEAPLSNSASVNEDKSKFAVQIHDVQATSSVNQSAIPHAKSTRTRLLARLAHEKNQAASTCAPVLNAGAEARVLRDRRPAQPSSSLNEASEDVDAPLNKVDDGLTQPQPHPQPGANAGGGGVNLHIYVRSTDPDGVSAGEDVRVREAKLRARVQLKARLAAEKKRVGGS